MTQTTLQQLNIDNTDNRVLGQVKWFNNSRGYGFITVTSGEHANEDIFVYQNNLLTTSSNVYRTLSKGEYVEFEVSELENNEHHKYHATSVTGPQRFLLMCETAPRRLSRHNNTSE